MAKSLFNGRSRALSARTVDLDYHQLLVLEGDPQTRVKVIFGGVWLTAEGETGDHFPVCGDEVALTTKGRAVLQALAKTQLLVVEPTRSGVRQRLRALYARLGRLSHA